MKRKLIFGCLVAVATAVMVGTFNANLTARNGKVFDITLDDIESLAACESIGWWDNDGNCVKNDADVYFCKSDTWYQITDCKQ